METLVGTPEFEQNNYRECEKKFLPIFPEKLAELRQEATPIEQCYLSHPSESFSLRFRETFKDGELRYFATLKDRGNLTTEGLDRLEVEVPVSANTYNYYKAGDVAVLHKLRAEVNRNVAVDFYDDGHIQVESEDPIAWTHFTERHGTAFIDVTGEHIADNEWRAHLAYRKEHEGKETLTPKDDLNSKAIAYEILSEYGNTPHVIVQISGRSGSGKSTIVREIEQELELYGLSSVVISTDDYHRGAAWLRAHNGGNEWTEWDHPVVYDTETMASDIYKLQNGGIIPRRHIDFSDCSPIINGEIAPADVTIIEGIYALSPDFQHLDTLQYDIPTPLATCVGRRLLRDIKERPEFADPAKSFKYMLEQAEPMWRQQQSVAA